MSMPENILLIKNRHDFRSWLMINSQKEKECWLELKRGKPVSDKYFYYIDAVEEALCFGWIDSKHSLIDKKRLQRFSPRRKNSQWSELNKARARRLIKLGLMTKFGESALPNLDINKTIDIDIANALKNAGVWDNFTKFPNLYQRIRTYNIMFYKNKNKNIYQIALRHLIDMTKQEKTYGEWNDYGRLSDDL